MNVFKYNTLSICFQFSAATKINAQQYSQFVIIINERIDHYYFLNEI